ncbi:helix-turn-helix transcriptional regulator [Nocardia wallacei]|uniref:Helix-turn-helix domain-containing protein n=1 Tax=Nocardia wallacei TaxID=480035 RepID=A0A7G1KTS3_9NOCA|nr:helix-turn-helix domain-containing protein [Nocardia wallacei]BCK58331.1 hypothetical protein NWFMUON74_61030 [Nocardia wallacei]
MQWLTNREAAAKLRIQPVTLARWRMQGRGPRYEKLGEGKSARIRYLDRDVEKWMADPNRDAPADAQVSA